MHLQLKTLFMNLKKKKQTKLGKLIKSLGTMQLKHLVS